MKVNTYHTAILAEIKKNSGVGTSHTFLDSYLGNSHPRYPINAPRLRQIAKTWAQQNKELTAEEFCAVLDSLNKGASSTEKLMTGILMDYATPQQLEFDLKIFEEWLEHLIGWAEVDAVCTGKYTIKMIPKHWDVWQKLLKRFVKSKNIQKRRAALVFLCSPVRYTDDHAILEMALHNVTLLKHEKEVLITKAISWLLRSLIKNFKNEVQRFVDENKSSLPAIAVRETMIKLKTGKKTGKKVDG